MRLVQHNLEMKNNVLLLGAFGDLHIASRAFNKGMFMELIKEFKRDKRWWIGMGDFAECIPIRDPRFDIDSIRETYRDELPRFHQVEAEELKDMLEPISKQCLGILEGNHESKLRNSQFDMMWELCNYFKWNHLTTQSFIRLNVYNPKRQKTLDFDIFAAHGYGTARTKGGNVAKLQRLIDSFLGDILLVGHTHINQPIIDKKIRLMKRTKTPKLEPIIRIGFLVPSFFETYKDDVDTYASKALYAPSVLGAWRGTLRWVGHGRSDRFDPDKLIIESPLTTLEG